jgi:hypothetical protein
MTFNGIILPISIVMGLLVFGLAAKWYVAPALARLDRKTALTPFLLFHGTRYIGLAFLISGVTAEPLDPRFAGPAAYGDLLAAALALAALLALRLDWPIAIPLVWIFNIQGTLDLLNALFQGFRYNPIGHFGATYFIPAVVVPALLVTHAIVFWLLLKRQAQPA